MSLPDFALHQVSRQLRAGVLCVLVRQSLAVTINETEPYKSFEHIDILLQFRSSVLRIFVIYRPPGTVSTSIFFDEFSSLLESVSLSSVDVIITGDFNLHVDSLENSDGRKMLDLIYSFDFEQHVSESTHSHEHIGPPDD